MRDDICLSTAPPNENPVQTGTEDYYAKARVEGARYIALIKRKMGRLPAGAELRLKSQAHDFGNYIEVCCVFDTSKPRAIDYCFNVESSGPLTWRG